MRDRLHRLQANLQAGQVDCLVLIPGPNLRYMTGLDFNLMERPLAGFFPAQGEPVFVLPALEQTRFERHAPYPTRVVSYKDGQNPDTAFRQAVMALPEIQRIAVEYLQMRVLELKLVQRHVPTAFLVDAAPFMNSLRLIKDADEIARMRQAITISEGALQELVGWIRPGMTERQIANRLLIAQLERGGGPVPFEPLVQFGPNAADPHGLAGDQIVQSGGVLLIDFGTTWDGYNSDITRTFVIGQPPDGRTQTVYQVVKDANAAGQEAAKPGVACKEVDRAARAIIEQAGFGDYFIHRTGHGIGLGVHEAPSVDEANDMLLEPGMVITIEPGIYIPGQLGIRIEDNILITERGAESLTSFTRDLLVIGVG